MNSDFKELLEAFNACDVRYLIVGGVAFIYHAEPRYTKDLDVWVKADEQNARRVYEALVKYGAPVADMSEDDFAREGYFFTMGIAPVRVDILMSVDGLDFEDAWTRRVEDEVDHVQVAVLSKEDLIRAKLIAGRPQDLIDVQTLSLPVKRPEDFTKIKREQAEPE
jgi:hypothetical protein